MLRLIELKKEYGLKGLELIVHHSDVTVVQSQDPPLDGSLRFNVAAALEIEVLFNGEKLDDAIKVKIRENLALAIKDGLKADKFGDSIRGFKV